jgi:hypothetical protein
LGGWEFIYLSSFGGIHELLTMSCWLLVLGCPLYISSLLTSMGVLSFWLKCWTLLLMSSRILKIYHFWVSSKVTYIDSSRQSVLLLYTLWDLLEEEQPRKIPTSDFESNLSKLSLVLRIKKLKILNVRFLISSKLKRSPFQL